MTPLSFAVLALAAVLFAPAVTAQANCSYAAIQCIQDKACNQSFQQYNTACASAYVSGLSSDCTSQCNTSLADALARQPNLGTCVCTDYTCSIGQRNLVKACYGNIRKGTTPCHSSTSSHMTLTKVMGIHADNTRASKLKLMTAFFINFAFFFFSRNAPSRALGTPLRVHWERPFAVTM